MNDNDERDHAEEAEAALIAEGETGVTWSGITPIAKRRATDSHQVAPSPTRYVQTCPGSRHRDWIAADTCVPLPCPWCANDALRSALDVANAELRRVDSDPLDHQ